MLKCAAFFVNIDFDIDFVFTEKMSWCFLNKVIIIKTIITRIDNDNNNDNNFNRSRKKCSVVKEGLIKFIIFAKI